MTRVFLKFFMKGSLLFSIMVFLSYNSYAQRSEIKRRLIEDSASWYQYTFPDTVQSILEQFIQYNRKLFLDTTNDSKQNYYLVLNRINQSKWQLQTRYDSNVLLIHNFSEKLLKTVFRYTIIAGLKIPVVSTEDYHFGGTQFKTDHDFTITFSKRGIISVSPTSGF